MARNINGNTKTTLNQITNDKPNVPQSEAYLSGYWATSFNGGHHKLIGSKQIMAGEKHKELRLQGKMKLLTPKTPPYQNLFCTTDCIFVPFSRIYEEAEAFTAQRGGATVPKPTELPNFGGKRIPILENATNEMHLMFSDTTGWRDSYISSVIPRMGIGLEGTPGDIENGPWYNVMPRAEALTARAIRAAYNDIFRNKEYDEPVQEFKSAEVTDLEWNEHLICTKTNVNGDFYSLRARKPNSYFTDYRTELQGEDTPYPEDITNRQLLDWMTFEHYADSVRQNAENAQKNYWDIIAEIRGSKKLTEGKVQKIGSQTFKVNYSSITQNAYNTNETIEEKFRVLGQQGAYSYTEIDIPLYAGMDFIEEGILLIFMNVWADTVFESGFDRMALNITPESRYRPEYKDQKDDVLYLIEMGTQYYDPSAKEKMYDIIGFKRRFSENFKLANHISGDLTTKDYFKYSQVDMTGKYVPENVITQKTYQFFEGNAYDETLGDQQWTKKPWLDYTDYQINKNQAIPNDTVFFGSFETWRMEGENQIDFIGIPMLSCILPIDKDIVNNFSDWGEH